MDLTIVDVKNLKNLEDLALHLTVGIHSLITLYNYQVRSIEIGIMKEDMNERANTILWDIRRLMIQYKHQLEAVLELLPDTFDPKEKILELKSKSSRKRK